MLEERCWRWEEHWSSLGQFRSSQLTLVHRLEEQQCQGAGTIRPVSLRLLPLCQGRTRLKWMEPIGNLPTDLRPGMGKGGSDLWVVYQRRSGQDPPWKHEVDCISDRSKEIEAYDKE